MVELAPNTFRQCAAAPALATMTGQLAEAEQLTEQAFLQVGRQVEEGHRRTLALAELAESALQLDAEETAEQTVACILQQTVHNSTWLAMCLQQRSAELAGSFGELVAALQFQDITRQRLQHIRQALAGLESAVAGGTADDAATVEICQLQHDQLQLAIHEFCGAIGLLDEHLLGMVGNVQTLAEDICAALLAGSNQESARIANIGHQAVEIGAGLQLARIGSDIRRQFLAQVEPVLAGLIALAREHGGAALIAGNGHSLNDLQKHYTMMSERVVHQRFLQQHEDRHADGARPAPGSAAHDFGDNVDLF